MTIIPSRSTIEMLDARRVPMKRNGKIAAAILFAILSAGCGKTLPPPPPIVAVEGVVLLDGKPLNNVEVRFVPAVGYGVQYIAKGITNQHGQFTLICNGKAGACECENRVLVLEAPFPAELKREDAQAQLIKYLKSLGDRPPLRYGNLAESPLIANVQAGKKEYALELTREE
jgi:hypothetical protein